MRWLLPSVFALLLLLTSGCQDARRAVQSAAVTDNLSGTWTFQGSGDFQLTLEPDGTYRASMWGVRGSGQWHYSKPFLTLVGADRQERMSLESWNFDTQPNWIELGSNGSVVRLFKGTRTSSAPQQPSSPTTSRSPSTSTPMPQNPPRGPCIPCNGTGRQSCQECSGTGTVVSSVQSSNSPTGSTWGNVTCPSCSGRRTATCWACRGSGVGP